MVYQRARVCAKEYAIHIKTVHMHISVLAYNDDAETARSVREDVRGCFDNDP
jgi:hypothetical protein